MEKIVVCIPSFNPTDVLLSLVDELLKYPFYKIIVVDDGSDASSQFVFDALRKKAQVIVLSYCQNEGKGKALKTAFLHIIKNYYPISGVLTCGADGQHAMDDIVQIAENASIFEDGIILGVRKFSSDQLSIVPRLQSIAMNALFGLLFKKRIIDIQSGLRYYPKMHLSWLLSIKANSHYFDLHTLIEAIDRKIPIYELPIGKARMTKSSFLQYNDVLYPLYTPTKLLKLYLNRP